MADSIRVKQILTQAKKKNYLKPTTEEDECLSGYINTGNYILYLLQKAGENGLSTSQVEHHSKLNLNTCKVYLREFVRLGFVTRRKDGIYAIWRFKNGVKE